MSVTCSICQSPNHKPTWHMGAESDDVIADLVGRVSALEADLATLRFELTAITNGISTAFHQLCDILDHRQ